MPEEKLTPEQGGENEKSNEEELGSLEEIEGKPEISKEEKEKREKVLKDIAEESKDEEDTPEQEEEKKTISNVIKRARGGFPIEDNQRIAETLGEIVLDPKQKPGIRKTLEQALETDPALFDAFKDWCVEHFDELVEAEEVLALD